MRHSASRGKRLCGIFLLIWAAYAHADFTGKVVGVSDGDTITVLRGREQVKVRLAEIDAPEKAQAFAQKSKQALADLVHGKSVVVVEVGLDRYRRTLGRIYLDDLYVNAEQVRQGMAWVFLRHSKDVELLRLQTEAREQRRGLWSDAEPVPPWEWRKKDNLNISRNTSACCLTGEGSDRPSRMPGS